MQSIVDPLVGTVTKSTSNLKIRSSDEIEYPQIYRDYNVVLNISL